MGDYLRSRQLNPCDEMFWQARGYSCRPSNWQDELDVIGYYDDSSDEDEEPSVRQYTAAELRSRRLNPCDELFWKDRGYAARPDDWEDELDAIGYYDNSSVEDEEPSDRQYTAAELRSRQLNPCDEMFWQARGYSCRPSNWQDELDAIGYYDDSSDEDEEPSVRQYTAAELRSRRLNPCDELFWKDRGYATRPDDWEDELYAIGYYKDDSEEAEEESSEGSVGQSNHHRLRSRQLNPCDHYFWKARGYSCRPDNWQEMYDSGNY